ncbi:cysteine--1-D-myo-inosityl 2-amino-2-deoxy-alpha-D-glucopyranoside ligase [Paenarthrobacter sp. DKR-5]|uniref:cysteine--1-D-myo-inosityl 2-amino-2-deoxy-alpha-D-glucopyranoside ligase n=1 Tax=Paenarthrobacter sp. DKR-5 TaxID=2835535 RepID=UPI001BDC1F6C|nr:cysteine--1-D-myo-inosityl 2-amino-2-deoxy-alpha-D-glucopyranoside ligase [Paenarthrobacter sp. DKR-5]MBT1001784.1 cysteine--1-D-myo-inosityl 2-amino-2-deoxy-alpha-D-glucopyranoside ligase [Paenarthrobacter sp. DKR-5]
MKTWKSRPVAELPGEMPAISLFNTPQGAVEPLPDEAEAGLYVCGITPYDATHMGHAATYVAFDLLNRAWRDAKKTVHYVQNVTDVDDPLLERAEQNGVDWRELAREQTELFHADMEALNVLAPDHYIGAVEAVGWIVPAVESLVDRGLAYRVPALGSEPAGDVYFDVVAAAADPSAWSDTAPWWLGQISGLTAEQMLPLFAERGGDPDRAGKRHALDPLLWRAARESEPSWDGGRLGAGRPGWHIECTVISGRFLPSPFTVQGGGSDLVFPHHEMGAGHAYALSGVPMARRYAHTGMVGLDGEKMSKSRGNLVLVSKLRAAGEEPAAVRLAILAHHYRSDWFWTDEVLVAAKDRLARWRHALGNAAEASAAPLLAEVRAALANDLDAPAALAAVDSWAESCAASGEGSAADAALAGDTVNALLGVEL